MIKISDIILGGILLFNTVLVNAQSTIVDDSTRLVYGPTTTLHFTEENIYQNLNEGKILDTIFRNFHRWNYVEKSGFKYQDLGVVGTALRPIFFTLPEVIGATSGFTAYDRYFKFPEDFTYFDSKSPHIDLFLVFGGKGRAITDVSFTRNVNPNWNVGMHFRKVPSDKQIQVSNKGDRRAVSTQYDVFTSFNSKNKKYLGLFNFSRTGHKVFESGGVAHDTTTVFKDLFNDEISDVVLKSAKSTELRTNVHYYHEYKLSPYLQVYHRFDKYRQVSGFIVSDFSQSPGYFDNFYISKTRTADTVEFKSLQNMIGFKGGEGKLFYSVYLKSKNIDVNYKYQDSLSVYMDSLGLFHDNDFVEFYLGGDASLKIDSSTSINSRIEYLKEGNHSIYAQARSKYFHASIQETNSKPSFLQLMYYGNHDRWVNDFAPTKGFEIKGTGKLNLKNFSFYPSLTLQRVKDYIYFNTDTIPEQFGGEFKVLRAGASAQLQFLKNFNLDVEAFYTKTSDNVKDIISIPEMFFSGILSYSNTIIGGNLRFTIGFDVHWKSAYYGYNYYPQVQQYFVQNTYELPDALSADMFLNLVVGRANVFFKMVNIKQMITNEGYLTAPYYIGQPDTFDFGFRWLFFD